MIKSVYLRRILVLIGATILLSALFTAILFTVTVRSTVSDMVVSDLMPRARYFSNLMTQYLQGSLPSSVIQNMISETSALGADIHVYDVNGNYFSALQASETGEENYDRLLAQIVKTAVSGTEVVSQVRSSITGREYLVVAKPFSQNGKIVGTVLLTKSLMDLSNTFSALNNSLVFSMLIAFGFMLVPAYLAARYMIRPVNQIRDVALHMAKGDYSEFD